MDLFDASKGLGDMSDSQFEDFLDNDMFTPPPSIHMDAPVVDFSMENGLEDTMDQNWFDTFFDDPVLNDRMISDALQPQPQVRSEHSYSLANGTNPLDFIKKEEPQDMDADLLSTSVNPNSMTPTSLTTPQSNAPTSLLNTRSPARTQVTQMFDNVNVVSTSTSRTDLTSIVKPEPIDTETTMFSVTRTSNPHTLLKPTIILATQSGLHHHQQQLQVSTSQLKQERLVLPKNVTSAVSVQVDPTMHRITSSASSSSSSALSPDIGYETLSLPPTPPSSNTSDSEGCQSPERSLPSSPSRQSIYTTRTAYRATPSPPPTYCQQQPFFMSPIPSTGLLVLSEEEKRTLITEGYPIPSKLPLSKTEERNLKKIRRKIKNKISAQESRRKKKEYLESLERKVESFCQENVDLKKKVDTLENNNRSLLSQLQKLQALVGKVRPQGASVSGSCLMVLVLCFAVFLGSWSPHSLSLGYSAVSGPAPPLLAGPAHQASLWAGFAADTVHAPGVAPGTGGGPVGGAPFGVGGGDQEGPNAVSMASGGGLDSVGAKQGPLGPPLGEGHDSSDAYSTPNMKSRVLLSVEDEGEDSIYGPDAPAFCLKHMFAHWFSGTASEAIGLEPTTSAVHDAAATTTAATRGTLLPKIERLDVEMEMNQTGGEEGRAAKTFVGPLGSEAREATEHQAIMHPDIAVTTHASRNQLNANA